MGASCDLNLGWPECWNKKCKEHGKENMEKIDNKGFTPGPWEVQKTSDNFIFIAHPGTQNLGDVLGMKDTICEVWRESNATLIAAAPEMYTALVAYLNMESHIEDGVSPIIDMARAALAKAEGRG